MNLALEKGERITTGGKGKGENGIICWFQWYIKKSVY